MAVALFRMVPMLRVSLLLLLPVALVAACASPQQQCIHRAAPELRTLDRLIGETQANLARGYGFVPETRVRWEWEVCDRYVDLDGSVRWSRCWEPVHETVQRPVAIDPLAEQRKLDALQKRRAAYAKAAEPQIAACRATYPE